ncbi:very short patch repair endonuclease [Endozoicomonas gorgoniicola]|uniref:Very short patch repair endonuclease n=1 Tax=Endozoicomonas gorgoniicola TaxID=1234144 RepID=A0ABT3N3M6_9GAMM|nr:very short patch repair endonuclease [Endozoicomonas gorgoniicola]MCW7556225.1 very short patch repair endonuclease [Endozoicomonas gorgoniicola]
MDTLLPAVRSHVMAAIHSKNTKPELIVRKALHALGFRYRIHCKNLPGSPDLVLSKYKAVIQVNGCFWHGHDCHLFKMPKTRTEYWQQKISSNQARDEKNREALLESGWRLMVVWECAIQGKQRLNREVLVSLMENWVLVGNGFVEIRGDASL